MEPSENQPWLQKPTKQEIIYKRFKDSKPLVIRKMEVKGIRHKFPTKIPVIVERYKSEKYLPRLDKMKYLVPQEMTLGQFSTIIRNRMCISAAQALFLTVSGKNLPTMSLTMAEIYQKYIDEDGFLYMTYASQEMFG